MPPPYPFCLWSAPASADAACSGAAAEGALPEAWRSLAQRLAAVEALVAKGEVDQLETVTCAGCWEIGFRQISLKIYALYHK